jgi:hypothetical protein
MNGEMLKKFLAKYGKEGLAMLMEKMGPLADKASGLVSQYPKAASGLGGLAAGSALGRFMGRDEEE